MRSLKNERSLGVLSGSNFVLIQIQVVFKYSEICQPNPELTENLL